MQICAAPRHLTRRVHQHPIRAADNAHQLAFCQDGATSNASPLGDVLDTLSAFLGHLHFKPYPVPASQKPAGKQGKGINLLVCDQVIIAAFVLLAANDLAELLVEHKLDTLLLLLLTLLLVRVFLFNRARVEDLGLHLEQLI